MKPKTHKTLSRFLRDNVWACLPDAIYDLAQSLDRDPEAAYPGAAATNPDDRESDITIMGDTAYVSIVGVLLPRANWIQRYFGAVSSLELASGIRSLRNNPDVRRIVLEIDSPGGVASGIPELAAEIIRARDSKEVLTQATGTIASAAYWVGTAASKVYATAGTQVGSIGVYRIHQDIAKQADEIGIGLEMIRAGEYKALDNPFERLSEKGRADSQRGVDQLYNLFVQSVAQNRGVSVETVAKTFGGGRVFLAQEANQRGMIDGVGLIEDGPQDLRQEREGDMPDTPNTNDTTQQNQTPSTAQPQASQSAANASPQPVATASPPAPLTQATPPAQPAPVAGNNDQPAAPDEAQIRRAERERIADIRGRGELLGISADQINAAVESGLSVERFLVQATEAMQRDHQPISTRIDPMESERDKVHDGVYAAFLSRFGADDPNIKCPNEMYSAHPVDLCRITLRAHGQRVTGIAEQDALAFLQLGGTQQQFFGSTEFAASGSPTQNPKDFPNVLSAIAGKMIDKGINIATPTYRQWCGQKSDAADLKPRQINFMGGFGDLPRLTDGDVTPQGKRNEGTPSWSQVERRGLKAGLTPTMIANDDMGAFSDSLMALGISHEQTIGGLAVGLVASNPTMADAVALFHATHGSLVASGSGGAPSAAQAALMRKAHRLQTDESTQARITNHPAKLAVVPAALEDAALRTYAPLVVGEQKTAAEDDDINTVRGSVTVVTEPLLDAYSTTQWYTFADPRIRPVISYTFMRGYRGGQRTTWVDPDSGCRWQKLEGRFDVFVVHWIGGVLNYGA